MSRRDSAHRVAGPIVAAALIVLSGCSQDDPAGPSSSFQRQDGVASAVAPSLLVEKSLDATADPNVFLLAVGGVAISPCDALLGRVAVVPPDPAPTEFGSFQNLIARPSGTHPIIQVQNDNDATPERWECDARDPTAPAFAVVDPVLLHAAKGNGPAINFSDVTFDLNGHSITSAFPAADLNVPPGFPGLVLDNLGIVVTGNNVDVINSGTVSRIDKFAHNIDVGGDHVTVDGTPSGGGSGYGIETDGRIGSDRAGVLTWRRIKSIDLDPILGQGGEVRRCLGDVLFDDNRLIGGAEGLFIRQCAGVTVKNNFIGSPHGIGISTRDATGTVANPNRLLNNTVENASPNNSFVGISLVDLAFNFIVTGNTVSGFPCGIQVETPGANGIPSEAALIANNTLNTTAQTCDLNFIPPGNQPPVAAFDVSCTELVCSFTDQSTDDGAIADREWNFGDGGTSIEVNPVHTFATGGLKTVTLTVTDNVGAVAQVTRQFTVFPLPNIAPDAAFSFTCNTLICRFSDNSVDQDGSIASRTWDFGDGKTSHARNPTHTYGNAGDRTVTLTVVDNQGQDGSISRQVITTGPGGTGIQLTLVGHFIKSKNVGKVFLSWSGVTGARVDLWRDGAVRRSLANDGAHTDLNLPPGTHRYKICKRNTNQCSAVKRVTF